MNHKQFILSLEGVHKTFDGFKAIDDLNFYMDEGELRVIIGPNGAGKSTMLDIITGRTRPDKGKVEFGMKTDLTKLNEYQINRIPGSQLIPLGDVPKRVNELDPNEEIVVHCKMGGRSAKAADFLRSVGFKRVLNLKGGILDWIDKVDPTQPKY